MTELALDRHVIAQRGQRLKYFTIGWTMLEGCIALVVDGAAVSISLVGFCIDSFIEVMSGSTLLWRMAMDADAQKRERNERLSLRMVGILFLALALYVTFESTSDLIRRTAPAHSLPG